MAKKTIISSPKTLKQYNYDYQGVVLNFTLRCDNSKELTAFKNLLEKALVDVSADLTQFK